MNKRGRPSRLTEGEKHELRRYREAGVSIARLASMWKISTTRVYEILAEQRAKFGPEQLPEHKQKLARRHLFAHPGEEQNASGISPTSTNTTSTHPVG